MSRRPQTIIIADGARLDRHALSPSGLAERRRLRLPRASARRLARRDGRRARGAAALFAATGRRPGADTLVAAARRHLVEMPSRAIERRRRAAVPLARAPARPSTAPSRPRATRWSTPMTAPRSPRSRSVPGGAGISPTRSAFPTRSPSPLEVRTPQVIHGHPRSSDRRLGRRRHGRRAARAPWRAARSADWRAPPSTMRCSAARQHKRRRRAAAEGRSTA